MKKYIGKYKREGLPGGPNEVETTMHGFIVTNEGQWKYPGQPTLIPSNEITMQGVDFPVLGIDDTGHSKMMMPGADYTFPGSMVYELPMAHRGKTVSQNWKDITGTSWSKAKELGLTSGIYDENLELQKKFLADPEYYRNLAQGIESVEEIEPIAPEPVQLPIADPIVRDERSLESQYKTVRNKDAENIDARFSTNPYGLNVAPNTIADPSLLELPVMRMDLGDNTHESFIGESDWNRLGSVKLDSDTGEFADRYFDPLTGETTGEFIPTVRSSELVTPGPNAYQRNLSSCSRDECSAGMQYNLVSHLDGGWDELQNKLGVKGDAWTMNENILNAGGQRIYGLGADMDIDRGKNYSSKEIRKKLYKARKKHDLDQVYESAQVGDIVEMYYPGSKFQKEAIATGKGDTYTTHVGHVTEKDGVKYVTHNVDGTWHTDKLDTLLKRPGSRSSTRGTVVSGILRPDYGWRKTNNPAISISEKPIMAIASSGDRNYYVNNDPEKIATWQSGAMTPVAKQFVQGLEAVAPDIATDFGLSDDQLALIMKTSFGVFGNESDFGVGDTYKKKERGRKVTRAYKYVAPDWMFEGDEQSEGLSQIKLENAFDDPKAKSLLKKYGISSVEQLYDPMYSSIATMLLTAMNYKQFESATGLRAEDIDPVTMQNIMSLAHNKGMDNVINKDFVKEGEFKKFHQLRRKGHKYKEGNEPVLTDQSILDGLATYSNMHMNLKSYTNKVGDYAASLNVDIPRILEKKENREVYQPQESPEAYGVEETILQYAYNLASDRDYAKDKERALAKIEAAKIEAIKNAERLYKGSKRKLNQELSKIERESRKAINVIENAGKKTVRKVRSEFEEGGNVSNKVYIGKYTIGPKMTKRDIIKRKRPTETQINKTETGKVCKECKNAHWSKQFGGINREPRIVNNPEVDRTYYDPISETIFVGAMPYGIDPRYLIEHENFHHLQNMHGALHYGTPVKRAGIPSTDEYAADYYNRKGLEINDLTNEFKYYNPEFGFVPDDVIYNKYVDYEQYDRPYTVEGEAQNYENYIRSGGKVSFQTGGPTDRKYPHGGPHPPTDPPKTSKKIISPPLTYPSYTAEASSTNVVMPGVNTLIKQLDRDAAIAEERGVPIEKVREQRVAAKENLYRKEQEEKFREYVSDYIKIFNPDISDKDLNAQIQEVRRYGQLPDILVDREYYKPGIFDMSSSGKYKAYSTDKVSLATDPDIRAREMAFMKKYGTEPASVNAFSGLLSPFSTAYAMQPGSSEAEYQEKAANTPALLQAADLVVPGGAAVKGAKYAPNMIRAGVRGLRNTGNIASKYLNAPLTIGSRTIPFINPTTLVGAGFATKGAYNLSGDLDSGFYTDANIPTSQKIERGLITGLDLLTPGMGSAFYQTGKGAYTAAKTPLRNVGNYLTTQTPLRNVGNYLTTKTPLRNAWKYNSKRFEPEPGKYYRQVGKSAIDDAHATQLVRVREEKIDHLLSPENVQRFKEEVKRSQVSPNHRPYPYFERSRFHRGYRPKGQEYLIESSLGPENFTSSWTNRYRRPDSWKRYNAATGKFDIYDPVMWDMSTEVPQPRTVILNQDPSIRSLKNPTTGEPNFTFYEPHWWKGYKPVDLPSSGRDAVNLSRRGLDDTQRTAASSRISKGFAGTGSIIDEMLGEILKGKSNKKAIAEGNEWLKNWIKHPATQQKIENDIENRLNILAEGFNYANSQKNYGLAKALEQEFKSTLTGEKLAKNFVPNSKEYPLLKQLDQNLQQYLSKNSRTPIHQENWGVSYMHSYSPERRVAIEQGLYPPGDRYGSWISRTLGMPQSSRVSTTIHEGTHDWVPQKTFKQSGMRNTALNNMNPEIKNDFLEWENLRKQGIAPKTVMGKERAYQAYLADPTEQHARIMELRKQIGLTPDIIIKPEYAKLIIDWIETGGSNVDPKFLNVIDRDPKKLAELFNKFWMAPAAAVGAGAAAVSESEPKKIILPDFKYGGGLPPDYELFREHPGGAPYAYDAPQVNGVLLPDPNRPNMPGTNATEYKVEWDGVTMPSIVNGIYLGPQGAFDRYLLTGEHYPESVDPGSYSRFYDMVYPLGLMKYGKGGLKQWFAEDWRDIKTGKKCGRGKDEKGRPYPACRPTNRVSSDTPKTTGEMSASEKRKFRREKRGSKRISYNHKKE